MSPTDAIVVQQGKVKYVINLKVIIIFGVVLADPFLEHSWSICVRWIFFNIYEMWRGSC